MYTPKEFAVADDGALVALMQRYGFATMITAADGPPMVTHLPLLVRTEAGRHRLIGHVARANPHWKMFDGERESLAIFHGPHGYVSPSLYESPNVPTWNYAVVHAHGAPRVLDGEAADVLRQMVSSYESGRPKPWTVEDLPAGRFERLLEAIVAFEMPLSRLEGKFKLSQNRSAADARNVADAFARSADSGERELSALMRALAIRTK